jgi:hypothetical protein
MEDLKAEILDLLDGIDPCNDPAIEILQDPNVFIGRWETDMSKAPKSGYMLLCRDVDARSVKDGVYEGKFIRYGQNKCWRIRNGNTWKYEDAKAWAHLPKPPTEAK